MVAYNDDDDSLNKNDKVLDNKPEKQHEILKCLVMCVL